MSLSSSEKIDVCIIGAGLAGLMTAGLLRKLGYHVEIFEKRHFSDSVYFFSCSIRINFEYLFLGY